MAISFHTINIAHKVSGKLILKKWLKNAISSEGCTMGNINIILCDDNYLHELNQQYLKHNTYTDIITFEYNDKGKITGDLFISFERVNENATKFKVPVETELHRIMIHGILHLCGYKDKTKADKLIMRKKEEKYLSLRPF